MSDFRWTLKDLHTVEQALEQYRAELASGERTPEVLQSRPGCERNCPKCDLTCELLVVSVQVTRDGLIAQGDAPDTGNLLVYQGVAYDTMAGRA